MLRSHPDSGADTPCGSPTTGTVSPDRRHRSPLVHSFERLFRLSEDERKHVDLLTARCEQVEPHRKLIHEGQPCRGMFVLWSGWLAEFKQLKDGGRQILNFRLPGDIVGFECLAYTTAPHSTGTLTRCEVAPLPPERFERIQREFPRLATALFLMALRDGAILHEWEVSLGRRSAFARIASLLLLLDRKLHIRGLAVREDRDAVPFPLTQQDVADCTGLSLPYVNRTLHVMRDRGFIRLADRKLEMLDRAGLAKAADFSPEFIENWGQGWLGRNLRHMASRSRPQPEDP